jgi:transcriptional regulator with XRE-family HTH domain
MLDINKRLIALRESRNITRTKIYKYIAVTRQTYNAYETGKASPSLEKLVKIAEFYNVSLDYLVGRSPLEWDSTITYQQIDLAKYIMSCNLEYNDIKSIFIAIKNSINKFNL